MDKLFTMLPKSAKASPPSCFNDPAFREALSSPEKARAWLDAHLNDGTGHLHEKDGYDCPICHNTGLLYRRDENTGELLSRECTCKKERAKIRTKQNSGISRDSKSKTFDTYQTAEAWQATAKQTALQFTQNCVNGSLDWFFIGGQPGSGKTHLAKAIFHILLGENRQVVYMSWKEDAAQLKAMLNSDGYKPLCDRYKCADVLFLDDFLKTRREANGTYRLPTDGDMNLAFEIIKHRDENNLVTVITSEFTIDAVYGFDQSVGGRIRQRCENYSVEINQDARKDYRQP